MSIALLLGWKWGALNGFVIIATAATIVVILVYMLVMLGSIRFYLTEKRASFNLVPAHRSSRSRGSSCSPSRSTTSTSRCRPTRSAYATWFALGWVVTGLLLGLVMWRTRPEALRAAERIYVEDETVAPAGAEPVPAD